MGKKYIFDNAIIYVSNTDISMSRVIKATEVFMRKVLKENMHDNTNQISIIREK